jgi:hypothetical protein
LSNQYAFIFADFVIDLELMDGRREQEREVKAGLSFYILWFDRRQILILSICKPQVLPLHYSSLHGTSFPKAV